jgi:hypothetical protein
MDHDLVSGSDEVGVAVIAGVVLKRAARADLECVNTPKVDSQYLKS